MKIKRAKIISLILLVIILAVVASFFVHRETGPPSNTRVIVEHTYKTYIAPLCFESADATNFIEESTLGRAKELNYEPHSSCTEDAMATTNDRFIISILKEMGILDSQWNKW